MTRAARTLVALASVAAAGDAHVRHAGAATASPAAPGRKVIAVITPSHDNPFFKAEAEAAAPNGRASSATTCCPARTTMTRTSRTSWWTSAIAQRRRRHRPGQRRRRRVGRGGQPRPRPPAIPSFLIDREINQTGIAVAQIVSNNYQGAVLGGEEFVRLVGERGTYIELVGRESDTNAGIRSRGFHDVLDKYPGLTLVGRQSANWSQTEAFQKMETLIQGNRQISGVICGNDTMALGAAAALKAASLSSVVVVGFDGSPDAIASIKAGEMKATVLQPAAAIARLAVEQAHQYITTGSTGQPEKQAIDCELVTPANADEFGVFARKAKESK